MMSVEEDKKPCPFCGNTYNILAVETNKEYLVNPTPASEWNSVGCQMVCMCCGAAGPSAGDAIDAERYWNEREK